MSKPGRSSSHGNPRVLEGYHPLALGKLAVPSLSRRLLRASALPASSVSTLRGYDDVTVSAEPSDGAFYGFYANGTYANGSAVKSAFPGRYYISITTTQTTTAESRCSTHRLAIWLLWS
jgi:hypothetical protein